MTPSPDKRHPVSQRLGVRLALALAISLLPLGVISGLQSRSLLDEARARSAAALLGETILAAGPAAQLIRSARVTAEALSSTIPGLGRDVSRCQAALRRLLAQSGGTYSSIIFVPVSGDAQCTTDGPPLDLSQSDRFRQMIADPQPDTVVIRDEPMSGASGLAFGHPVYADGGPLLGYVSISVPHEVLNGPQGLFSSLGQSGVRENIALTTFDAQGTVLTSTEGLDAAADLLPRDRALPELAQVHAQTFTAATAGGERRIFAVFPLIESQIFAVGSWPLQQAGGFFRLWISPYLMPAMMGLASLLVAILAAEQLVTRHIRALRGSMIRFAAGDHRHDDLRLPGAAAELRDVTDAYRKMTFTILHDEAELEDMVHQREVLLREVHHRVKNNLQLISSIISMQMRQSHSPEARVLMRGLQDRVMSLATIHRGLYQTSGLADVRADELLSDIVRQIVKMSTGPGRVYDVRTDLADLRLTPDQAVPLSLLMTEALTNALKYAGTAGLGLPVISVILRRQGAQEAELLVTNTVGADDAPDTTQRGTRLGGQLLMAFGQQLGAQSETTFDGGVFTLRVRFTLRALAEGETGKASAISPVDDPPAPPPVTAV